MVQLMYQLRTNVNKATYGGRREKQKVTLYLFADQIELLDSISPSSRSEVARKLIDSIDEESGLPEVDKFRTEVALHVLEKLYHKMEEPDKRQAVSVVQEQVMEVVEHGEY